jgi:hypothetical protein
MAGGDGDLVRLSLGVGLVLGAAGQWSAWIGPLSSARNPAAASVPASIPARNSSAALSWPATEGSGRGASSPGSSSSRPWLPA